MATVDMLYQALYTQITTAFQGSNPLLNNAPVLPIPEVGIDWPAQKCIGEVSSGRQPALLSFFDRGATKNITHAIPLMNVFPDAAIAHPSAIITSSNTRLHAGDSITLTGSSIPVINDAFCLTLMYGPNDPNQLFANYTVATSNVTLVQALDGMVTQINLLIGIVASRSGNVITVQNNTSISYDVRSEVTNIATVTFEGYRWLRDIQVTLWVPSPAVRSKYGDVLEQLFTQLEINYGFLTSDNSACRLTVMHDHLWTDSQLQDYYRRDFILQIDYPVIYTTPAYPIETIPQTYGILS